MRSHAAWVVLLLGMAGGMANAQQEQAVPANLRAEVFPLGSARAAEVLEALPQVLTPAGKVELVEQGRAVRITDTPAGLAAARSILEALAVPAPVGPNVRIQVQFQQAESGYDRGIDVRGGYQRAPGITRQGDRIRVEPIERGSVGIGLQDSRTERSSNVTQMLLVASGREASLEVGQQIPYVDYFYDYALGLGIVQPQIRWAQIGSRLRVRPTVAGNNIHVEVTPEISALVGGRWQTYAYESLSTTVTVANGGSVTLGGFSGADARFNQNFFSTGSRGRAVGSTFTLTASIDRQVPFPGQRQR